MKNSLSICSINIINIKNRKVELLNYIHNKVDIICVQESGLTKECSFNFKGYAVIRKDKGETKRTGGICILIKNDIKFSINNWYDNLAVEALSIHINTNIGPLDVINYYQNCNTDLENKVFEIASSNSSKFLIAGDINASNTTFGSSYTNKRGEQLLELLSKDNLILLNDDTPTFYHRSGFCKPNILDLAICTPNISTYCNFFVGEDIGSDHLPIHIHLGVKGIRHETLIRNFSKVNWKDFNTKMYESFQPKTPENISEIKSEILNLTNAITESLDIVAPKKPILNRNWWKFTPEIREKIKLRRKIRRLQKQKRDLLLNKQYNQLNKEIKKLIQQQKENDWKTLSENLNIKNQNLAWKTIKRINSKNTNIGTTVLKNDTQTATSNIEKANMMASHLKEKQKVSEDNMFDQCFKTKIDTYIINHPEYFNPHLDKNLELHILNNKIDIFEFINTLKKCKSSSSNGPDGINYAILKNLSIKYQLHICDIMTKCLRWGYYPDNWKQAQVIMIPKQGKDKTYVKNYRPISLTSCMGKTLERIITNRLVDFLMKENKISPYQCGFLKNRSTDVHLTRLSQDIYTGLKRKHPTSAVFLDVEGAFDCVWQNGLKYKLLSYNFPINIIRFLSNFLDNRSFNVKEGNDISDIIYPEAGTPQGSALSPLLYILFTNDMPIPTSNSIKLSLYADDTAFWMTCKNVKFIETKLQAYLDKISQWCLKWFIKINPAKTQLICFHHSHKQPQISLNLNNSLIQTSHTAKFLGITFDSKMTFKHHIKQIRQTMFRKSNILRSFTGRSWGTHTEYLINIFKAWVLPNIEYGCTAFLPVTTNHLGKIQVIQNAVIRAAYRLPIYTPLKDLHEVADLPTIREHILHHSKKSFNRIKDLEIVKITIINYVTSNHIKSHKSPLDILTDADVTLI